MSIDSVSDAPISPPESRTIEREREPLPVRERQEAPEPREPVESSASSDPARGRTIDILV